MKTRALLVVGLLAVSPLSYGYGDALFHALLKKSMDNKAMVSAAPEKKVVETEGVSTGAAAVGFGVTVVGDAMPCTSPVTVAAARGELDEEDLDKLDQACQ